MIFIQSWFFFETVKMNILSDTGLCETKVKEESGWIECTEYGETLNTLDYHHHHHKMVLFVKRIFLEKAT